MDAPAISLPNPATDRPPRPRRWIPLSLPKFVALVGMLLLARLSLAEDEPAARKKAAQSPAAAPAGDAQPTTRGNTPGEVRDDNGLKMKFLWCPAGKVIMEYLIGSDRRGVPGGIEKPDNDDVTVDEAKGKPETTKEIVETEVKVVPVTAVLSGFWLGKYEVTRDEWQAVMGTEPWANRKVDVTGGNYPASYVSWNDATEFCKRLTEQERKAGRLPDGWQYTLPTEAQWEFACRAKTETLYSFGDDESRLGSYAWIPGNTIDRDEPYPHRVGRKKPNPWGLCDMHGNVSEWCRDWSDKPPGGQDPEVKERPRGVWEMKVQRGGGWNGLEAWCRSNVRACSPPDLKKAHFGFRVALSAGKN
ncbi:MAG: formylglycine-generating enzyme family protein [Planctomycetia bacterium]|nr:formylglycine-generating enzyme family protein [Planctomycetia bacterium]